MSVYLVYCLTTTKKQGISSIVYCASLYRACI